jgi:hypothetical protein
LEFSLRKEGIGYRFDDLESEAVRQFAEGGLKGEGLLSGIVAPVNDTRNSPVAADRSAGPGATSSDGKVPAGRRRRVRATRRRRTGEAVSSYLS